jgi:hypothetical protein
MTYHFFLPTRRPLVLHTLTFVTPFPRCFLESRYFCLLFLCFSNNHYYFFLTFQHSLHLQLRPASRPLFFPATATGCCFSSNFANFTRFFDFLFAAKLNGIFIF